MESSGDVKVFLQALIQLAAACVHLTRGNAAPGMRLLSLAREKLEPFGDRYAEVDVESLRRKIARAQNRMAAGEAPGEVVRALQL